MHFIPRYLEFDRAVGLAFDQIRHYGSTSPTIMKKLLATLSHLVDLVPEGRRQPLMEQREAVRRDAEQIVESAVDRGDVQRVIEEVGPRPGEEPGAAHPPPEGAPDARVRGTDPRDRSG